MGNINKDNFPGEYSSWSGMKSRCSNPNVINFSNYGGRGITVCERWQSFSAFLEDMGPKPSPGLSIERTDTNGNYEPRNCVWADRVTQNNNRRNNHIVEYRGETMTVGEAIRKSGSSLPYGIVNGRLHLGWKAEDALTEPILSGERLRERQSKGASKANRRRQSTHCKHGHEFTDENRVWITRPGRTTTSICRECQTIKRREYNNSPGGKARKRAWVERRSIARASSILTQ